VSDGESESARYQDVVNRFNLAVGRQNERIAKLQQNNADLRKELEQNQFLLKELKDLYRSLKFVRFEPLGDEK
jgi:hypothetical protein